MLRRASNESFLPGRYDLPGGGLEPSELPEDGIIREVNEETGLSASVVRILHVRPYGAGPSSDDAVLIVFLLKLSDEDAQVRLSEEHDEYRWIERSELDGVLGEGPHPQASDPGLIRRIVQEYFESDSG